MLVANLQSPRTGRPVANQYVIIFDEGTKLFQSYTSIIARIKDNEVALAHDAWLTRTTKKYLKVFLDFKGDSKSFNNYIDKLPRF